PGPRGQAGFRGRGAQRASRLSALLDEFPRIFEEAQPGAPVCVEPFGRAPAVLEGPNDTLGVGHHDGHAATEGHKGRRSLRGPVRVLRVAASWLAGRIDVTKSHFGRRARGPT